MDLIILALIFWAIIIGGVLKINHGVHKRNKEFDRMFKNYVNRKKGRHTEWIN